MELNLLAASIRSRQDFELIRQYIDVKLSTYSKPFQILMAKIHEYYSRDKDARNVETGVLMSQLEVTLRNPKHVDRFKQMLQEALAGATSDANVRAVVLMAKQQEVADRLTQELIGDSPKVDDSIEELKVLRAMTNLEELNDKGLEAFDNIDILALVEKASDPKGLIQVYPRSLNDHLDGGAKRQHHLLFFGPVEVGKTASVITANCGFARQGLKSLYFINEDKAEDIILRHIANLSGMNKHEIYSNPKKAQSLARDSGFSNIIVVSAAPGSPKQIRTYIDRYNPDCIIVDQLRNLAVKADTRVNQLETAATEMRNIGKEMNVLVCSVTQAGDSAKDKITLEIGDVDFSNVGIPSQADVMVGIGKNAVLEAEGLRQYSLCKNKLSGDHGSFPVRINPQLSRVTSV